LSFYSPVAKHLKYTEQKKFNQAIIDQYFELYRSARQASRKRKRSSSNIEQKPVGKPLIERHLLVHRTKRGDCLVCRRDRLAGHQPRIALGEVSANNKATRYRKISVYGCFVCDITLCKKGPCFDRFHSPNGEFKLLKSDSGGAKT
jgi:hypothetical protein